MDKFSNNHESQSYSENKLQIVCATWDPQDRVKELEEILQDASVEKVEKQFQKYVRENIEPAGWQAVWRSQNGTLLEKMSLPMDFFVDVVHVSQFELKALVIIKNIINNSSENIILEEHINKEVSVPLLELYPTSYQENEVINIETTTEILEQIRFFYENIMLPWDAFEEIIFYNEPLLRSRIELFEEIRRGIIPRKISVEMENIKSKAEKIAMEILKQENHYRLGTESPDSEIDQIALVHLMKLNKQLDILKTRYNALKDPILRELSTQEEHLERSYILSSSFCEEPSNVFVVASSVPLDKFAQSIAKLPKLLKEFSQVPDLPRVKTLPSLQMALDAAQVGDVVALLSGTHILKCLGSIGRGGMILGLDENVEIVGCHETGDVVLDLNLEEKQEFVLQSLLLKPVEGQAAAYLHKGKMLVKDCVFQEGLIGLSFLGESECQMLNSTIRGQEKCGISAKNGSRIKLDNVKFEDCKEAAMLAFDGTMISIESKTQVENCEAGLKVVSSLQRASTEDLDLHERCIVNFKNLHFKGVKENSISVFEKYL